MSLLHKILWFLLWLLHFSVLMKKHLDVFGNTGTIHFVQVTKTVLKVLTLWKVRKVLVSRSRPTLCDPMDCSPPGPSVYGISQTRILEWVAVSFSRGYSWPRDRNWVISYIGRQILYCFSVPPEKPLLTNFQFKKRKEKRIEPEIVSYHISKYDVWSPPF